MPHPLLDASISPLRQRPIDDVILTGSARTQRNYLSDSGLSRPSSQPLLTGTEPSDRFADRRSPIWRIDAARRHSRVWLSSVVCPCWIGS